MGEKLLIIGGVAAGATAAARARRLSESVEITLLERGPYVSYANCGLPYFIGGDIKKREALLLQTPQGFLTRYRVDVRVNTEALELDLAGKRVRARGPQGEAWLNYDKLILAQGGQPIWPGMPGGDAEHVFKLWTVPDMDRIDGYIREQQPKTAVVVGGGFIGLEMAEALVQRGLHTAVVELAPTVMAVADAELGMRIGEEMADHGVNVVTGVGVQSIDPMAKTVLLSDGRALPAELVLFSVGVRPDLALAKAAGLAIGPAGGLQVDEHLKTSDNNVYAAGDMVEILHRVAGKAVRLPLAGPANRQGRLAASNALGHAQSYRGALGTSVVKVFAATAALTGLSYKAARAAGLDVGVALLHKEHHATYYPGAKMMMLQVVYERPSGRLLGAQAFGHAGVEKRVDVLATALAAGMTVHDLAELDLAYAPPFASANDPVNLIGFVAENDLSGYSPLIHPDQLVADLRGQNPPLVLDVRNPGECQIAMFPGAQMIPLDALRDRLGELPLDRRIAIYCKAGYRGHLALRILKESGFADVVNIAGGYLSLRHAMPGLGRI